MTSYRDDALSETLGVHEYSRRHDIWLWHKLYFYYPGFSELNIPNVGMRDKIAHYLQQNSWLIRPLMQEKSSQLVSEKELSWIRDDRRQVEWITRELQRILNHNPFVLRFELTGRDLLVAILDISPKDTTEKTIILKNLEQDWLRHKANDRRYAWFENDDQKCQLAYDWLAKNASFFMHRTPFEKYEDILIFFDQANYPMEKEELYITKIKKVWNQRKYRTSLKGKAQYNFILSNKTANLLDEISTQYEISRARVLEILVEMEAQKGLYITEKLKNSRILDN